MAIVALSVFIMSIVCFAAFFLVASKTSGNGSPSAASRPHPSMDFIPTQLYVDEPSGSGIAVHDGTKQLSLLRSWSTPPRTVTFMDLVASLLVKNGDVIMKEIRTHPPTLAQHAQKAGLLGGSSAADASPSTQHIELVVVLNDLNDPVHRVTFLDMEVKEGGMVYEQALRSAEHWHHLVGELIRQADCRTREQEVQQMSGPNEKAIGSSGARRDSDRSATNSLEKTSS